MEAANLLGMCFWSGYGHLDDGFVLFPRNAEQVY
jgi:hypothetical protein